MKTKRILPTGATHTQRTHQPFTTAESVLDESTGTFASVTWATRILWENTARLGLPKIRVLGTEYKEPVRCFYAESVLDPPSHCVNCRKADRLSMVESKEQDFADVPLRDERVTIRLMRKRYRCARCTMVWPEPLTMMDDCHEMTRRLLKYIAEASLTETFSSLSREIGISEKVIRTIAGEFITELDAQANFQTPVYLGLDELCFRNKNTKQKGKKQPSGGRRKSPSDRSKKHAHAMLTDLQRKTVFELLPGNDYETMVKFLLEVPNREHIKLVCVDFFHSYRKAAHAALPHADIVIDKFHLLKCVNKSLERVRKNVKRRLSSAERKGLTYDSRIVRKRRHDLTPDEKASLREWTRKYPKLGQAYRAKERFYAIWNLHDVVKARARYHTWCDKLPREIRKYFESVITTVGEWDQEAFAYFKWRGVLGPERKGITNSVTESMNGVLREMLRNGRGYSFKIARGKVLYSRAFSKFQFKHTLRHLRKHGELNSHYEFLPFSYKISQNHDFRYYEGASCSSLPPEPPLPYMKEVAQGYLVSRAWEEKAPPQTLSGSTIVDSEGRQRPITERDIRRQKKYQNEEIRRARAEYPHCFAEIDADQHARTKGQSLVNDVAGPDGEGAGMAPPAGDESPCLTNSMFVSGRQCLKRLYLEGHPLIGADQDPRRANLLRQKMLVWDAVRDRYPEGSHIASTSQTIEHALADTARARQNPEVAAILDATFLHEGVLVHVDVLERVDASKWQLIQCHIAPKLKDGDTQELALQAYVLRSAGVELDSVWLLHVNKEYVRIGDGLDIKALFVPHNMTESVTRLLGGIPRQIAEMKNVVGHAAPPAVEPSGHCQTPYPCPFWGHCTEHKPARWLYWVPDRGKTYPSLSLRGIETFDQIPKHVLLRSHLRRVKDNVEWVSPDLRTIFLNTREPMHHLQVGMSIQALPPFSGTRPWYKLPFVFSHILDTTGEIHEVPWVFNERRDPRQAFIHALLDTVGREGTIYVYSNAIAQLIRALARQFFHYRADLEMILARLVDLRVLLQEQYFHPDLCRISEDLPYGHAAAIQEVAPILPPEYRVQALAQWNEWWPSQQYQQLMAKDIDAEEHRRIASNVVAFTSWGVHAMQALRQHLMAQADYVRFRKVS